jgi:hypothetical protein
MSCSLTDEGMMVMRVESLGRVWLEEDEEVVVDGWSEASRGPGRRWAAIGRGLNDRVMAPLPCFGLGPPH